jgi:hypothetical protein
MSSESVSAFGQPSDTKPMVGAGSCMARLSAMAAERRRGAGARRTAPGARTMRARHAVRPAADRRPQGRPAPFDRPYFLPGGKPGKMVPACPICSCIFSNIARDCSR